MGFIVDVAGAVRGNCQVSVACACTGSVALAVLIVRHQLKRPVFNVRVGESQEKDKPPRAFSRKALPSDVWDAIIIGSGPGGLACAVTLAKQGRRVLVLEQHDTLGGSTHTFIENGFEFDSGLHYIGGKIWDPREGCRMLMDFVTDGAVLWHRTGDVSDVSVIAGKTFTIHANLERLRVDLLKHFPAEGAAIDRYFRTISECHSMAGPYFAHKIMPWALQVLLDRFLRRAFIEKYASKTTLEVLRDIGASPDLIGHLCFLWGDYGLPPSMSSFALHAIVVNHYLDGGAYPVEGPSTIAKAAKRVLEAHGGCLLVRAPVQRILVEKKRAVGVNVDRGNGVDVFAPIIVSAVGATATFLHLLPEEHRPMDIVNSLKSPKLQQSCAHLSLFIGLQGSSDELKLPSFNTWISASADHDWHRREWYNLEPTEEAVRSTDFAAVFITFPSAKDPSWTQRHGGKSTCHMIAEAPYEWFHRWRDSKVHQRSPDYEALKQVLTEKFLKILIERFPQVNDRIVTCSLGSPLTTEHYLGSASGASYGLSGTPERFGCSWLQPRTHLHGFFLTGQDVLSMGVLGAFTGGFLTALTIDRRIAWSRLRLVASL